METSVLALLKKSKATFISGEEISRQVHISRAAVWKHVRRLRAKGYAIDSVPHHGYRLSAVPDCLLPEEISWNLKTQIFGQSIVAFEKVPSTNTIAYGLAEQGMPEGTLVVAERQSAGRGRLGRSWVSPRGGIYASLIVRPDIGPESAALLTLMTACAITRAIRAQTGIKVTIKWPNDLYLDELKVGGILTEMNAEMDCVHFVVIGFGLNVNTTSGDLPPGAAALREYATGALNRVQLLQEMLCHLEALYAVFRQEHKSVILAQWRDFSCTLGRKVRVAAHHEIIEGWAEDIDETGALFVKESGGRTRRILSGDVELVGKRTESSG